MKGINLKIRVRGWFLGWLIAATSVLGVPSPEPESGEIGLLVGNLLSREHYKHQPLNDAVSRQFLKFYLDTLDYNHLMFLQSDIQEFQKFANVLDDELLNGNVKPGFDIFSRYLQRVEERVVLVDQLLKEPFSFNQNESILVDRSEAPWPASEQESRQLWRQRVKYELLQEKLNKKKDSDAKEAVSRRYHRLLRNIREEDAESVLQIYLTSLAHVYDPHSDYLSPTELNNFAITMKLSLVGIGALLSSEDGYPKVIEIIPGGPADLDRRLKVNDRISGVAQGKGETVDVVDMKLSKAVELIRGKKDTEVRLQIIPADATDPSTRLEIKLKRDEIKITEAEAKAKLIEHQDGQGHLQRLGCIELPSFYSDIQVGPESKSTTRDVARLLEKLKDQKVEGLILDLRRNGGGSLGEALSLTGLFIKNGPIVQIKDSRGRINVLKDENSFILFEGPLIVLVSHISASASEILAAALQDYGRAMIVGDQSTFGKGTVQRIEELSRYLSPRYGGQPKGGALKMTVQKFYRISGNSTQYRGVIPDIQLPSPLDYLKINEASYKNALPYDEVAPISYARMSSTKTILPELQKYSQERVAHSPEFSYIQQDIQRLKVQLEEKNVSLNEKKRLQEKKENGARIEKRKKERLLRKEGVPQITEISLQSLSGVSSNTAALTRKVMDEASARLRDSPSEITSTDPLVDPIFSESIDILSDMIKMSQRSQ